MKDITGVSERITKSAGDFFGEMALLTGEPRSATVVASTKARCLALEKADFDRVVGPLKQLIAMHEHKTMLTNIPILKNLSEMERTNAVRRFKLVTYKRGAVIVKQGAAGDRFFVIGSGSVTVTRAEAPDFVAEFSPGQFFGELVLLNPADKRSATVTAKTECACYYLTRQAFAQVRRVHGREEAASLLIRVISYDRRRGGRGHPWCYAVLSYGVELLPFKDDVFLLLFGCERWWWESSATLSKKQPTSASR